jgi:hypothetical protein
MDMSISEDLISWEGLHPLQETVKHDDNTTPMVLLGSFNVVL